MMMMTMMMMLMMLMLMLMQMCITVAMTHLSRADLQFFLVSHFTPHRMHRKMRTTAIDVSGVCQVSLSRRFAVQKRLNGSGSWAQGTLY